MSRRLGALSTVLLCGASLALTGCPRPCPDRIVPGEQLVARYNANAAKVPSLWAVADVQVRLSDGKRLPRLTDGRLLVMKRPADTQHFMLRVRDFDQEFFRLGVDGSTGEYYYWADPPAGRGEPSARWGYVEELRQGGYEVLPVNPVHLLDVLGVMPWHTTGPGRQVFSTPLCDPCVYELDVVDASHADGVNLRKFWLDRRTEPHYVKRVWLYDPQGRCVATARLDRYRKIAGPGEQDDWPVMPTDILMEWPLNDQVRSIRIRLSQPRLKTSPEGAFMDFRRQIPSHIQDRRRVEPAGEESAGPDEQVSP